MSLTTLILAGLLTPTIAAAVIPIHLLSPVPRSEVSNITCSQPAITDVVACQDSEEQILKATVRIRIDTWVVKDGDAGYIVNNSVGHATVKDGRYLVTHNHFDIPLSIRPRDGEPEAYGIVTLFNSAGDSLYKGPLSDFELVWEDPETLVIAHKDDGLFQRLGFVSVPFQDWTSAPLAPGMEVAQVDWDGKTTRVDWTTIQEVNTDNGVPRLVLADDVLPGASGGGIFWQGVHIANNWALVEQFEGSGALVNAITKAALNSNRVVEESV